MCSSNVSSSCGDPVWLTGLYNLITLLLPPPSSLSVCLSSLLFCACLSLFHFILFSFPLSPLLSSLFCVCLSSLCSPPPPFTSACLSLPATLSPLACLCDCFAWQAEWIKAHGRPLPNWPVKGEVSLENYQTRYRPGLDLVLKGVTCRISAGQKVSTLQHIDTIYTLTYRFAALTLATGTRCQYPLNMSLNWSGWVHRKQ